jgi:hypothetical protein
MVQWLIKLLRFTVTGGAFLWRNRHKHIILDDERKGCFFLSDLQAFFYQGVIWLH